MNATDRSAWQNPAMTLDDLKLILVPTDFDPSSVLPLRAAVQLARAFQAAIEVFHVDIDPSLEAASAESIFPVQLVFESLRADTANHLERIVADVRASNVACTSASELGRSHTAIVEHARRIGAGLIVMGGHGRHGLGDVLIGSVAEKVVRHAPCAVLVVPTSPEA